MLCTISSAKFKIVELALCIACVVLHDMSYDFTNGPLLVLASGTFIGYLIILSGMILGEFLNNPVDLAADIFWSLAGAVLCLVVSGLMLRHNTNYTIHHLKKEFKDRKNKYASKSKSYVSLTLGCVLLLDAFLGYFASELVAY